MNDLLVSPPSDLGLGFMTLQTLAYKGYIQIDHGKLKEEMYNMMDFNKDGQIDLDDGQIALQEILKVLQYGVPSGSGFGAGFISGIRSG